MEIFLGVVAVILVLYMAHVNYKRYKARQKRERLNMMIRQSVEELDKIIGNCCQELEPTLRPDIVKVSKPKKTKKKTKVLKKKVSKRK